MNKFFRTMLAALLVSLLSFIFVNSVSAEEQEITEEDLLEIEENMEPVSPENPTSTYTTESGVTVERKLEIEDITSNDEGMIQPLSTAYRETRVSLEERYWIQNITQATFNGSWDVGVQRDGPVDILGWNNSTISVTSGGVDQYSELIDQTRGTSELNSAQARLNVQLTSATLPNFSDSERNVDWIVNITPDLTVSGELDKN